MPTGTMSTNRRAKRTPACLARASLRPCMSWMRSSARAARRRSRSAPPSSWATSSVSQAASAVGSARRSFSTATVRAKSVDSSHSRWAAANAGRSSAGPRRPTSNSAWGIDRPSEPVRMRISSIIRGHASCAWRLPGRRRRAGTTATGKRGRERADDEARQHAAEHGVGRAAAPTRNSAPRSRRGTPTAHVVEPGLHQPLARRCAVRRSRRRAAAGPEADAASSRRATAV